MKTTVYVNTITTMSGPRIEINFARLQKRVSVKLEEKDARDLIKLVEAALVDIGAKQIITSAGRES